MPSVILMIVFALVALLCLAVGLATGFAGLPLILAGLFGALAGLCLLWILCRLLARGLALLWRDAADP